MLKINEVVLKVLNEVDFEKILEEKLKTSIEKTIEIAVGEVYGSRYSNFGEALKKELSDSLSINLKKINIPQYNCLIGNALKNIVKKNIKKLSEENMQKLTEQLIMGNLEEEYNLSELIEMLKKEADEGEVGGISLHISESGYSNLIFIYIDFEEDKENYDCNYRIYIDKKENKISSLKIKDKDMEEIIFAETTFDGLLTNIFLQGKKINLDNGMNEDNYDLHYGWED